MKPDITYPYMPDGRELKYVPADHPFMQEAKKVREEQAGDPLFPVGNVMVKDGVVVARGGNGFNRGRREVHVCPRVVMECKSGEGYDLCDLHGYKGHAERMVIQDAREKGIDTAGTDLYMYGHWWACEPCWQAVIDAGVQDLYVTDDAHERFSRDHVYQETLQPSIQRVYISGGLSSLPKDITKPHKAFYKAIGRACEEVGVEAYVPHLFTDPDTHKAIPAEDVFQKDMEAIEASDALVAEVTYPSLGVGGELIAAHQNGMPIVLISHHCAQVSRFVLGNPSVVYHVQYETYEEACKMVKNVIKQL